MNLTDKEKKSCCKKPIWDFVAAFIFVIAVTACCQGAKDGNRLNKDTERLRNEIESRP